DDLLQRLANAKNPDTGAQMSDALLIDNLLTFFLAGHDTTAKALTWTLYLLARAPDWQNRILEEVRQITGDGPIRPDHINKIVITTQVLKESMRLFPPAPVMTRQPTIVPDSAHAPLNPGTQNTITSSASPPHNPS